MRSFEKNLRLFYAHSKKGRGNMLTRIFGAVTGGRLNLRAAASSSATIIASIPNETLLFLSEYNDTWYAAYYGAHTGFVKSNILH